jgi:hypothetical protein
MEKLCRHLSIHLLAVRRLCKRATESPMIEFKPRTFVLPAIALTVLALLHAPADGGRAPRDCGLRTTDPGIRASFAKFEQGQSVNAARICALAANTIP